MLPGDSAAPPPGKVIPSNTHRFMLKGTWKVNHAVSESSYNISVPNTFESRVHNLSGQLQARLKQETFLLLFIYLFLNLMFIIIVYCVLVCGPFSVRLVYSAI